MSAEHTFLETTGHCTSLQLLSEIYGNINPELLQTFFLYNPHISYQSTLAPGTIFYIPNGEIASADSYYINKFLQDEYHLPEFGT